VNGLELLEHPAALHPLLDDLSQLVSPFAADRLAGASPAGSVIASQIGLRTHLQTIRLSFVDGVAPLNPHDQWDGLRVVITEAVLMHERQLDRVAGAVRQGHFVLASGRHSDIYVEKFRILERPPLLAQVCADIVEHYRTLEPDVVVGPSTGGIIVAYEIARQLKVPAVYVETENGSRSIRRGGHIEPGAKVLLVDDVLTTGVSLDEVLGVLDGAQLVGIGVLIDRSEGELNFPCEIYAACRFEAKTFAPEEVPEWLAQVPVTKPGTRARHLH
jgi:orotate phosphoribosyltransferase